MTQGAVSKNSLLFMNQCCCQCSFWLCSPVLLAHAAAVCHALVNHNRLFLTLPYIFLVAPLL